MRARTLAAGTAVAMALTACGSTVQQSDTVLAGGGQAPVGDGLSGAQPGELAQPGQVAPDGTITAVDAVAPAAPGAVEAPTATTGGGPAAPTTRRPGQAPTGAAPVAGSTAAASGPRITAPIKLGFVNTKVGNAEAAGLNVGQTATPEKIFKTLTFALNQQGGLAGRKIVPVIANTDTASNDWNSDFQAACARLTEDDKVEAVVGYVFVQLDSFEACLAKAGVPHLSGAYTIGDQQTLTDFPNLIGTNALTADRRFRLQLEGAVREGYVTKASKLGIVVDGCPSSLRAVKRAVDPYIKSAGLTEAARVTFSCPSGAGDVGAAASQVQAAVLRFRQAGVDRVVIEGIPLILFAQSAESQGYRPGYLVSSTSPGSALEPNMPRPQLENVRGYGWMPHMDVGNSSRPAKTAAQQRCLALLKSGGYAPREFNDFLNAYTSCDGLFAYEAALKKTAGRTGAREIVQAVTGLGSSLPGVGLYGGRADYSRRNAPTVYRSWRVAADCGCFRYTSPERPIS